MAFIPYLNEDAASDEVRRLLDRCRDLAGRLDNILRIHAGHPESLEAHRKLYTAVMRGPSALSRVQREMIAVVVSVINECHY